MLVSFMLCVVFGLNGGVIISHFLLDSVYSGFFSFSSIRERNFFYLSQITILIVFFLILSSFLKLFLCCCAWWSLTDPYSISIILLFFLQLLRFLPLVFLSRDFILHSLWYSILRFDLLDSSSRQLYPHFVRWKSYLPLYAPLSVTANPFSSL